MKRTQASSFASFYHIMAYQKTASCVRTREQVESASALIFDFPASQTLRNNFVLFIKHPVYDILLLLPERTKTSFLA
jgi:hypothetical protein